MKLPNIIQDLFDGPGIHNASLKEPEWWKQSLFSSNTGAGVSVTPDSALTVSAVYACVRIIAETVASLPLKIYTTDSEGNRQLANHPLNNLLGVSPNDEQTSFELREFIMTNLGLRGNAYSQILRNGVGGIVQINPLNARYMNVDRNGAGQLIFDYREPGNAQVFTSRDIWRVAGIGADGVTGLSPVGLAREGIGASLATESLTNHIYSNGATTTGTLEFEKTLTTEQISNLREQFKKHYAGNDNAGKPLILESGMKFNPIGMTAKDAQFIESRKFQITEVCRWFRVPPHMLAEMDSATFSNIEHQSIDFVTHTIRPWLVRLEQTIARDLLSPTERQRFYATHTVEGLLRGDTATRYEAYGKAINDGWASRNEIRRLENLNPVDGLDDFLLPLNMGVADRNEALTDNAAGAMAAAELKTLRLEADKLTPEEFNEWLPSFYSRHKQNLADSLQVDPNLFTNYCFERIESFRANPGVAMSEVENNAKQDIKRCIV